jgi:hypothetical protein
MTFKYLIYQIFKSQELSWLLYLPLKKELPTKLKRLWHFHKGLKLDL